MITQAIGSSRHSCRDFDGGAPIRRSGAGRRYPEATRQSHCVPHRHADPVELRLQYRPRPRWLPVTNNLQPVIPFKLNEQLTLVVRTILPVIAQGDVFPGAGSQAGFGDTLQSFFLVPSTVNGFTWGLGPALQYRTGTRSLLTSRQMGRRAHAGRASADRPLTIGFLTNHIWSFAGDAGRSDVNNTFIQPFIAYAASDGWTFTVNSQSNYDWIARQWSIPVLFQVSKLTHMGHQPISLAAGVRYWAQTSEADHTASAASSASLLSSNEHCRRAARRFIMSLPLAPAIRQPVRQGVRCGIQRGTLPR